MKFQPGDPIIYRDPNGKPYPGTMYRYPPRRAPRAGQEPATVIRVSVRLETHRSLWEADTDWGWIVDEAYVTFTPETFDLGEVE